MPRRRSKLTIHQEQPFIGKPTQPPEIMKRSRQFASLLTAGLALLTVPAFAQSGSPAGSSAPGASPNRPNPTPGSPSTPSTDRFQPRVDSTRPPADTSTNAAGQLDRDRSSSTSSTSVNPNYPNGKVLPSNPDASAPAAVAGPNARASLSGQFSTLDRDSDGRISLGEFGAYTGAGVANPASRNGVVRGNSTTTGSTTRNSTTSGTTGTMETPGSVADINSNSVTGTGASAASVQLFQQLDTNRDGYLSRTEINASSQPRTQP
jgi:hypothetical protein